MVPAAYLQSVCSVLAWGFSPDNLQGHASFLCSHHKSTKRSSKVHHTDYSTETPHWWQLDRVFVNGSSKYKRWMHNCSKSNLHRCPEPKQITESHCYWKYPCCLYRRWCSCSERIEVSAGLRGRRRCVDPPAESRAILQRSIARRVAQFEGETPPDVSLREKNLIWRNVTTSVILAACKLHVMVGSMCMSARVCACVCVCSLSAVSWRWLCNRLRSDHKMYIKGTYCAYTAAKRW